MQNDRETTNSWLRPKEGIRRVEHASNVLAFGRLPEGLVTFTSGRSTLGNINLNTTFWVAEKKGEYNGLLQPQKNFSTTERHQEEYEIIGF